MYRIFIPFLVAVFILTGSSPLLAAGKQELVFGAISVGKVSEVKKSLQPLLTYIEGQTGTTIRFETGKDYADTIDKFKSGYFDLGYIGPSPYIIATAGPEGPGLFQILGGLETSGKPFFHASIIAAKDNEAIQSLADLKGKKFAFGSRQSTLSFYMPCKMLMDSGVFDTLSGYEFLGKHDKVAQYVAMGGFDGGGIKEGVAKKNLDSVKVIATSDPVYDFLFVAHKSMDPEQAAAIASALQAVRDPAILEAIKQGVTGIIPTSDANYDGLRQVMAEVDKAVPE